MQRLVSSEHLTVASPGTWKAHLAYWVLTSGITCLASATAATSPQSRSAASSSHAGAPGLSLSSLARSSAALCSPRSTAATSASGSANRSFTDSSPAHDERCVLRSTNTVEGPPLPYHRSLSAVESGSLLSRAWYSSRPGHESRYTLLMSWESPSNSPSSGRNTGRCSSRVCFTALTSSTLTQNLRVDRTNAWAPAPAAAAAAAPAPDPRLLSPRSRSCRPLSFTTNTLEWSASSHGWWCSLASL
mmetsp:Transcript_14668/g.50391  ORF Transcript_14668/g.50391 Transcript_14668/m.50391 type:complete len:245 (+) Transcript_14668:450-1184(+)